MGGRKGSRRGGGKEGGKEVITKLREELKNDALQSTDVYERPKS